MVYFGISDVMKDMNVIVYTFPYSVDLQFRNRVVLHCHRCTVGSSGTVTCKAEQKFSAININIPSMCKTVCVQ